LRPCRSFSRSFSLSPRPRSRLFPLLGVFLFLFALLVPEALGGAYPVVPDPTSQQAQQALGTANTTRQSIVETISLSFNVTFPTASCGSSCVVIPNGVASMNNPTSFGASSLGGTTTITPLTPPTNPGAIEIVCDGAEQTYVYRSSLSLPEPCYSIQFLWGGMDYSIEEGQTIQYLISHTTSIAIGIPAVWTSAGLCSVLNAQISSIGSKVFYVTYYTQKWNVTALTYAVGLPKGDWNLPATTFYDSNASTFYPSNFFVVSPRSFLAQWQNYPSLVVTGTQGKVGYNLARYYRLSICLSQGSAGTQNQTIPNGTAPSPPSQFPTAVTVDLGPFQQTSPGNYTTSGDWVNNLSGPFSGAYYLIADWVASVGYAKVYSNGQLLLPNQYAVTNTSIEVYPSVVTTVNGTAASFTVTFQVTAASPFTNAVFFLNGFAVTPPDLWMVGVLGLAALLVIVRLGGYKAISYDLVIGALGTGILIYGALTI
jgi:hypothetical protein